MKNLFTLMALYLLVSVAISQTIIIRNPGCSSFDSSGICTSCASRFYRDQNNICQPVNSNCRTYDEVNGDCLSCYAGFGLLEGTCLPGIQSDDELDPNCNQFNDKTCVKCSYGFYFGHDGKCVKADENCQTFDDKNGDCTSCFVSFVLSQGKCIKEAPKALDPNCNQFDANNQCVKCSSGFYFNQGKCQQIDSSCKLYDINSQQCKECYPGYVLNLDHQCVKQTPKDNPNPLCAQWNGTLCTKCAKGSTLDQASQLCLALDTYCKSFNATTGACKKCYSGYSLSPEGTCHLDQPKQVSDPNCNSFSSSGQCSKCSTGYFFNEARVCTKIDDSCKSFSVVNKKCMDCYSGYRLSSTGECIHIVQEVSDVNCAEWNGTVCKRCSFGAAFDSHGVCVVLDSQCRQYDAETKLCKACWAGYELNQDKTTCVKSAVQAVLDVNCAQWSGMVCLRCAFGSAFNNLGKCTILDAQCKDYDQISGLCKACYSGYELNNLKVCVQSAIEQVSDPLCAQWNSGICVKCSPGSFFGSQGQCTQIDASCRAANPLNGQCLGCYDGYKLDQKGVCVKHTEEVSDVNCAQWNGKVCLRCAFGAAFNNFGRCVTLDSQCKEYDQVNTKCKACYQGYALDDSYNCVKSAIEQVKDALCAEWSEGICLSCAKGSFFNHQGICSLADSSCKEFDPSNGKCLSCWVGYELSSERICLKAAVQQNTNPLCAQWDLSINLCIRCASGSFFNGLGICEVVDPLCKTSNALSGACTSCFDGYEVTSTGKCIKAQEQSRDPLCAEFVGTVCQKCSFGAYFNSNGVCQQSDSLCLEFNQLTGACTKCYPGHALVQGRCQVDTSSKVTDPFCAEFQNQLCLRCAKGYYFQKDGKCTAADPLCATFDQMNGHCLSCYPGYEVKSGMCVQKAEQARDPNCAVFNTDKSCKECSKGFIFNSKGQCSLTNSLCKSVDSLSGACTSCYAGYIIQGSTCVLDQNAEASYCAQMSDDICLRCASRTFMNSNGQCEKVSEDCRTYNDFDGQCLSCYSGFALNQGKCVKDNVKGGCSSFDSDGKCSKCATGFYLNSNSECAQVDAQCAKFNFGSNLCEGCYSGYTLLEGKCEVAKVNEEFEVKNCVAYNLNNKCIQCFDRFFLTNNACKEVSVFCKTYDLISGQCTGCYSTFKLRNGECKK